VTAVQKQVTQHKPIFKKTICPFTGNNCRKDCELYVYYSENKQGCVFRVLLCLDDMTAALSRIGISLALRRGATVG